MLKRVSSQTDQSLKRESDFFRPGDFQGDHNLEAISEHLSRFFRTVISLNEPFVKEIRKKRNQIN